MRENAHLIIFEDIELFGHHALLTAARIDSASLPSSVFLYELRHDIFGDVCSIEPKVKVNFEGTVLSSKEIKFAHSDTNKPWSDIAPDDINYLETDNNILSDYMQSEGIPFELENNAGYDIIYNKNDKYVIGYRKSTPDCSPFVVWQKNRNGNGYDHGFYCNTYEEAYRNMNERYKEYVEPYLQNR